MQLMDKISHVDSEEANVDWMETLTLTLYYTAR